MIDFNPWPVRRADLDHPDELRVDLDPTPEASWDDVRQVAMVVNEVLEEHGLRGYPKTSGSRASTSTCASSRAGTSPRCAARRSRWRARSSGARRLATSKWWKEERHGVFVDYNQNARDRTVASAWSVRPTPDARVSCRWRGTRCPTSSPPSCGSTRCPARLAERGDPAAAIDARPGSLDALHALAERDEAGGLGDAPWPPHFRKQRGEPKRVQPSRDAERPRQRGRAGDPQPGGPADPQQRRPHQPGKRRAPRTGQGFEDEFEN